MKTLKLIAKLSLIPFFLTAVVSMGLMLVLANGSSSSPSFDNTDDEIIKTEDGGTFIGPFVDKNYTITSDVGSRPLDGQHEGIDLTRSYGSKVIALCDAEVFKAKYACDPQGGYLGNKCPFDEMAGGGNHVVLRFTLEDRTYYVQYLHLSEVMVSKGDKVKQGQVIGKQGNSGNSTGSHLHVEIHHGGLYTGSMINWVSPRVFLDI